MTEHKLRSGVNWQKGIKDGLKTRAGCMQNMTIMMT
jgi:hypothetical protein